MSVKNNITNEELNQRFENPFALVNYSISLAKARIQKGDITEVNPAAEILEEIASGEDLLVDESDEDTSETSLETSFEGSFEESRGESRGDFLK